MDFQDIIDAALEGDGVFIAFKHFEGEGYFPAWEKERQKYLVSKITDQNLRQVFSNEVIIEFDHKENFDIDSDDYKRSKKEAFDNVEKVKNILLKYKTNFIITDHKGKSPHIRFFLDGLADACPDTRAIYKSHLVYEILREADCTSEHVEVDESLFNHTSTKLISVEDQPHWKSKYNKQLEEVIFRNEKDVNFAFNKSVFNSIEKKVNKKKLVELVEGAELKSTNDAHDNKKSTSEGRAKREEQILRDEIYDILTDKNEKNKNERIAELLVEYLKTKYDFKTIRDDQARIPEMYIYLENVWQNIAITVIKEKIRVILRKLFSMSICNMVIVRIAADTYVDADDFFTVKNPHLIAVKNGVLDLRTCDLAKKGNYDLHTKIPVTFDKTKDCPNFLKALGESVENKEDVMCIQEMFGYCLWQDYFIEKAFMLSGNGRNGKGKCVMEPLKVMLGAYNVKNIPLERMEKDLYSVGELVRILANICDDLSSVALESTGNFKSLTGHGMISAPRKYKSAVSFVSYAKQIFSANEIPSTKDLTTAFFNRWMIINFPFTFLLENEYNQTTHEERIGGKIKLADPHLIDKITTPEELSGILNWSLEGLKRLRENKQFSYSHTTEETRKMWIRRSNPIAMFCEEYLIEDHNYGIAKTSLYLIYGIYCKSNRTKKLPFKKFKDMIENEFSVMASRYQGPINGVHSDLYLWEGLRLNPKIFSDKRDVRDSLSKSIRNIKMFSIGSKTVPIVPNFPKISSSDKAHSSLCASSNKKKSRVHSPVDVGPSGAGVSYDTATDKNQSKIQHEDVA